MSYNKPMTTKNTITVRLQDGTALEISKYAKREQKRSGSATPPSLSEVVRRALKQFLGL